MIRSLLALSVVLFAALACSAQTPVSQLATEHFTAKQLHHLMATARTPAEHERLANYFALKAQEYRAEAQMQARMLVSLMANSATNNDKAHFGTVDHCDFMFKSFIRRAQAADKLVVEQQQLAQAASPEGQ